MSASQRYEHSQHLRSLAEQVQTTDTGTMSLRQQIRERLGPDGPHLRGYASGSRTDIWTIAATVWAVADELCLTYATQNSPNALDENFRSPARVSTERIGTPAECSVLCASVLTSLGLNAVLTRTGEHSLFGCWLTSHRLREPVLTDPLRLRELMHDDEMLIFDPTDLYGLQTTEPFQSIANASEKLGPANDAQFAGLIDLSGAARASRPDPGQIVGAIVRPENYVPDSPPADAPELDDFEAVASDAQAMAAMAVALNRPRATADRTVLGQPGNIPMPVAARHGRSGTYLLAADGDQRSAIKAVNGADSFVVAAPAGSGAQQCAAGMIGQALANKQTVLYLARHERTRADVVGHLWRAGLSELCDISAAGLRSAPITDSLLSPPGNDTNTPAPNQAGAGTTAQTGMPEHSSGDRADSQSDEPATDDEDFPDTAPEDDFAEPSLYADHEALDAPATAARRDTHPAPELRAELARVQQRRLAWSDRLHRPDDKGWTLHQALGMCIACPPALQKRVNWQMLALDELPDPVALSAIGQGLSGSTSGLSQQAQTALAAVGQTDWSEQWEQLLVDAAQSLIDACRALATGAIELGKALPGSKQLTTQTEFRALQVIAQNLPDASRHELSLAASAQLEQVRADVTEAINLTEQHEGAMRALSTPYRTDSEQNLPMDEIAGLFDRFNAQRSPLRSLTAGKIRRLLQSRSSGKPNVGQDVPALLKMRELRQYLDELSHLQEHFPWQWQDVSSNFKDISERLERAEQLALTFGSIQAPSATQQIATRLADRIQDTDSDTIDAQLAQQCDQYLQAFDQHANALRRFIKTAVLTERISGGQGQTWPDFLNELARGVISHRPDLQAWCAVRRSRRAVSDGIFDNMAQRLIKDGCTDQQIHLALRFACARRWLQEDLYGLAADQPVDNTDEADMPLAQPDALDELIVDHRHLSDAHRQQLASHLVRNSQTFGAHPCIVAPESALAAPSADREPFDWLIIGDADQYTVAQITPLLRHARRAILISDLFTTVPSDDASNNDLTRGLVDEPAAQQALTLGAGLIALKQDYSGRHPDLLALANLNRDDLPITGLATPAAHYPAIRLSQVQSNDYGHANQRSNRREAREVARQAITLLNDWAHLNPATRPSMSILAMTGAQVALIQEALAQAARPYPALRDILGPQVAGVVSVRHINQANERVDDVVLLSTTVSAPANAPEQFIFDPFCGTHGARRLYAAIGAARLVVHVITSLPNPGVRHEGSPADPGLHLLGELMRAGESANATLAEQPQTDWLGTSDANQNADDFTTSVRTVLNELGWQLLPCNPGTHIGVDIVVENPDDPGHPLAGLVTDAGYGRQALRDIVRRDDCRERALINIGWNLINVWPLAWWFDYAGQRTRLAQQLSQILHRFRSEYQIKPLQHPERQARYSLVRIGDVPDCDPDSLTEPAYRAKLEDIINRIVQLEGPIRQDNLLRRILTLHNRRELNTELEQLLLPLIAHLHSTPDGEHRFLWPADVNAQNCHFRPANTQADKRLFTEIAPEELAAAARDYDVAVHGHRAERELARVIGLAYPGSERIRQRLRDAVQAAADHNIGTQ